MSDLSKQLMLWHTLTDIEKQALAQQQAALIDVILKLLQACDDAMEYMSEYDIPIMLPTQVKAALQAAKEAGFNVQS